MESIMNIIVDKKNKIVAPNTTLEDCIKELSDEIDPVAVFVNSVYVPKAQYATRILSEGDQVRFVKFLCGG
jgi:thiamine biosynthesis protein ThiS